MFNFLLGMFGIGGRVTVSRFGGLLGDAQEIAIEEFVYEGIEVALAEMEGMVGNPGQQAIYDKYIVEAFPLAAEQKLIINRGNYLTPEDINMPHKEAVEIILQVGCDTVNNYYEQAQDLDTVLDFI
jgi:hypothetical protein